MISVIVPIYNVAPYLDQCIQSICGQTYRDIEIILVDDGSTDNSLTICEKYRAKDNRIKIIHKENGGLVSARKAGLQIATGAFIGWVDGDDWIDPNHFEEMVSAQKELDSDLVAAGHFVDTAFGMTKVHNNIASGQYSREELLPKLIYSGDFFEFGLQPYIWSKLIRSDIIKPIEMEIENTVEIGEDVLAVYPAAMESDRIRVTNICTYHYVQHSGSMLRVGQGAEREVRLNNLICGLRRLSDKKPAGYQLEKQLMQYKKLIYLLYHYAAFECNGIFPYGAIPNNSRLIIFGAGMMGTSLYRYYTEKGHYPVVAWIDSNWHSYMGLQKSVQPPDCIKELEGMYDVILIANAKRTAADQMRKQLLELGVLETRIRWLTSEFIDNLMFNW